MENTIATATVLDRMLRPLGRCFDAEAARRIIALPIDPEVVARVEFLADRANEGLLTEEEREEYRAYVDAADLIALFKSKARAILDEEVAR